MSEPRKAVIKNVDMSEDMQQDAVDCATVALEKFNIEKDVAAYIKKVRCCLPVNKSPFFFPHSALLTKHLVSLVSLPAAGV